MNQRNRGLMLALSAEAIEGEDMEAQVDPVVVDPDHPDVINNISLIEYAELHQMAEHQINFKQELGEAPQAGDPAINGANTTAELSQESFSDHWGNFKNRFEGAVKSEEAYVDAMRDRFKKLKEVVQSATDKEPSQVPISIFSNAKHFQLGRKTIQNPAQLQAALQDLLKLADLIDKDWIPSVAKEIKYTMDYLQLGAVNVDGAYAKAYVVNAANPSKGMEALASKADSMTYANGKSETFYHSNYFMGSFTVCKIEMNDYKALKVKRGYEVFTRSDGVSNTGVEVVSKVQIRGASRTESLKMIDTCLKILEDLNHSVDTLPRGEVNMMMDKVTAFVNNHRGWRTYPTEERHKISMIISCAHSTDDRDALTHGVISKIRLAVRAVERYIEMSMQRAQ